MTSLNEPISPARHAGHGLAVCAVLFVEVTALVFLPAVLHAIETSDRFAASRLESAPSPQITVRDRMVGVWEDNYHGRREMILNEDGTGTMFVYLSGPEALFMPKELKFGEEWLVEGDLVTMRATGGEPAAVVSLILATQGSESTQRIIEVTDEIMILIDQKDGTRFEWRRLPDKSE